MLKKPVQTAAILSISLLTGCSSSLMQAQGSANQDDADLVAVTAFSLGLPANEVTITNRQNDGVGVNYWVKTKEGREYTCMRSVTMFGAVKSSPICGKKGEPLNPFASHL